MTEQFKSENPSTPQHIEVDIVVLIKKMQMQLSFLDKKIDILINQSQEKPSRERHFSKPFRSFDRHSRPGHYGDKRNQGDDFRERSSGSSRHFEKRQGDEQRGPGGPKKDYSGARENNSSQDRPFKKKFDGKKRKFDPRQKPFFHKRKDQ